MSKHIPVLDYIPILKTEAVKDRSPEVKAAIRWLDYSHLPLETKDIVAPLQDAALELLGMIEHDTPELVKAIDDLVTSKDKFVRAAIRGFEIDEENEEGEE